MSEIDGSETQGGAQPGRRERARADKLRRIREAAEALFREKGFEAATTREIAARADVGTGTLFTYVADKRDLLFLIYRDRIGRTLEEAFRDLPAGARLADRLHFLFARLFALYGREPELARHFVKEQFFAEPARRDQLSPSTLGFLGQLAELVRQAQERGEVDAAVPPEAVAWSAFALYFAALTGWLGGWTTQQAALDEVLRPALELQQRGLAGAPGQAQAGQGDG